jgi:hypothetical protein
MPKGQDVVYELTQNVSLGNMVYGLHQIDGMFMLHL